MATSASVTPLKTQFDMNSGVTSTPFLNPQRLQSSPSEPKINPIASLMIEIDQMQNKRVAQTQALRRQGAKLQEDLNTQKNQMNSVFNDQRVLEGLLSDEKTVESSLMVELNLLQNALNDRVKNLKRLQTQSRETQIGYEKMAKSMAEKLEIKERQYESEVESFVDHLQEQQEAIAASSEELTKRQQLVESLRQYFSQRAMMKGETENEIAGTVVQLKKCIEKKILVGRPLK